MAVARWKVIADDTCVEEVKQGSPGSVFQLLVPSEEVAKVDLRLAPEVPWSSRCKLMSDSYFRAGETHIGLFWLNVATEALIHERVSEIATALSIDLEGEVGGSNAYWDDAKSVVEDQFPSIAPEIQWPSGRFHVSVFRKLKYLHRHYDMSAPSDDVLANYSRISKHRNSLFHGSLQERLPISEVERARTSYDWLGKNLRLQTASS